MTRLYMVSSLLVCMLLSLSTGCSREKEGNDMRESRVVKFGTSDLESLGSSTNGLIRFADETLLIRLRRYFGQSCVGTSIFGVQRDILRGLCL